MRSVLLGFFALSIGASFYWFVEQNWISLDPIMHARNKRLFDPSSSLSNLQGPVKKIGFLKTHKTASSTIQNILLRYGLNHNLTFVLPSSGNYLTGNGPRSEPFQEQWLNSLPWHRRFIFTHQYDIIALHTRWNFEQFRFVLGSDAVFFTILRDPSEVFESLFTYASFEEAYQINITEYLRRSKDPFYRSKRLNGYLGLNQQLWDLGVNLDMSPGKKDIKWHIKRLDQQFDLVLITDLIDESLVLLAQLLRVPLSEMVSLKINARKKDFKLQLSKKDQTLLKKLQSEEMQLYTHFRQRLLRQIQIFGRSKMRKQVKTLQMLQQSAYEHCVLNETDKDDLEGTPFEPYHKETVAYRVRSYSSQCSPEYFRQRLRRYRQMRIPRLRKLASILQRGDYDRGDYVPAPGKTITDEDKDRLISRMVNDKDGPSRSTEIPLPKPRDPRHQAIMEATTTEELDLILVDDLLEEIQERQDFLSELRKFGVEHQYSSMIQTEITQKIREAEKLLQKNRM